MASGGRFSVHTQKVIDLQMKIEDAIISKINVRFINNRNRHRPSPEIATAEGRSGDLQYSRIRLVLRM